MSTVEVTPELQRILDVTVSQAMIGNNSAFLGSLICATNLVYTTRISTLATDGMSISINPDFFTKASPKLRLFAFLHELWHPARLHFLRRGEREAELWNIAADHEINLALIEDGYDMDGFPAYADKQYKGMAAEEIYTLLQQNPNTAQNPAIPQDMEDPGQDKGDGEGGNSGMTPEEIAAHQAKVVQKVIAAVQAAEQAKQAGSLPGTIKTTLKAFLKPIVPWANLLDDFMTEVFEQDYTWARPRRRYEDMYLPTLEEKTDGKLTKLHYYLDVSGSISKTQLLRFNSEVAHIKEKFNPDVLVVITFDTRIQNEIVITTRDQFDGLEVTGGGGTSLECVRRHIEKNEPIASMIFTDLYCNPMEPVKGNPPIIWIVSDHMGAKVPFGKVIYINE